MSDIAAEGTGAAKPGLFTRTATGLVRGVPPRSSLIINFIPGHPTQTMVAVLLFALAVGPAEMGQKNDARPLLDQQFERGQSFLDAGDIVNDHPTVFFLQGHVVIHTRQHAFAAHCEVFDRQLRHKEI